MSADWYYAKDQRELGPIPLADLQALAASGALTPSDLVWTPGMPEWQPAGAVSQLAGRFLVVVGSPPPLADPQTANTRVSAGIAGILVGGLGVHKFILNLTTPAVIMLCVTLAGGAATCGVSAILMHVIGMIEGIKYLLMSDQDFHQRYVVNKQEWF